MEVAALSDTEVQDLWATSFEGICGLQGAVGGFVLDDDVLALQRNVEHLARRVASLQVGLQAEVERRGLHRRDGHATARVMARHVLQLSEAEASDRAATVRSLRSLPEIGTALAEGRIGVDQVRLIARVHGNARVGDKLANHQAELLREAGRSSYRLFARKLRDWERLVDTDGAFEANERNHHNREAKLVQDGIDLSWDLTGRFGAEQGARLREILDRFVTREWQSDWAEARSCLGPAATTADLRRTDAQRRADALDRIFADAAGAPPGSKVPSVVHNIVWSADTYFALLAHLGIEPDEPAPHSAAPDLGRRDEASAEEPEWSEPRPPADGGPGAGLWCDPAAYRCETLDGVPLEPVEALCSSLANHVRRVVVNARGVVIDLGEKARLFTGSARLAAQLQHTSCIWPGCHTPTSRCEIDHLHPNASGGMTGPGNGAPLCGFHNRWKQKGYANGRDGAGRWRTYRPDGSEIL